MYSVKEKNNSLNKLCRRINYRRQLDEQSVESVLKKCPNIKRVIIMEEVYSEVLSLFGQYCPHFKSLRLVIDRIECLHFFPNYGHKLEELIIDGINCLQNKQFWLTITIRGVLKLCPNLKKVNVPEGYEHFIEDEDFLPKLEFFGNKSLVSNLLFISSEEVNKLKIMSDKYSKTMKTLKLYFGYMSYEELKTCIGYVVRFENLKELILDIKSSEITEPIDSCLSLIGQKCNKLLKLELEINFNVPISDRFFDVFTQFKTLKKLRINLLYNRRVLSGSVESFRHCKQLIELDLKYSELREDFFTNIATFVPKLQFLRIYTTKKYYNLFIDSFLSMKDIQRVELRDNSEYFPKTWNFRKCLTEIMLSPNGKHVIRVNDYCGKIDYKYVNYDENNPDWH